MGSIYILLSHSHSLRGFVTHERKCEKIWAGEATVKPGSSKSQGTWNHVEMPPSFSGCNELTRTETTSLKEYNESYHSCHIDARLSCQMFHSPDCSSSPLLPLLHRSCWGLLPHAVYPQLCSRSWRVSLLARPSLVGSGSIYRFQSSRCLDSPSSSSSPGWKSNLSG